MKRKRRSSTMVKRKEGLNLEESGFIPRKRGYVTNLGLAEVDRIINGHKFRGSTENSSLPYKSSVRMDNSPRVDVISRLPDEILQFIISILSMTEGAATCILSTRWRTLWATSIHSLNFDIPTMLGYNYPKNMFKNKGKQFVIDKISNFTHWVNGVFQLRRASRLHALRICFVLDKESASHIDGWIKSASAEGVTDMELDFNFQDFYGHMPLPHEFYEFPAQAVASSLKYLTLKHCIFHIPLDFIGFTSLVSLSLNYIILSEELVDNILCKCPLLECLSLVCCFYDSNIKILTFSSPTLVLKHLHILEVPGPVEEIQVHDVNLLSLELLGFVPKLSLKNAPHLARLVLFSFVPLPIETLTNVPCLEILFLRQPWPFQENNSIIALSPVFTNLKRLAFVTEMGITNFLGAIHIIQACPLLQELELNMGCPTTTHKEFTETLNKLTTVPQIPHNKLKEIELYGFEACPEKIEFVKYLLNYALLLQKMKIYTASKVYRGNGSWILEDATTEQVKKSLKQVKKLLQKDARSSAKLELSTSFSL